MAYYGHRRPTTPAERFAIGVVLIIMAFIMYVWGLDIQAKGMGMKKRCSGKTIGTVTAITEGSGTNYKSNIIFNVDGKDYLCKTDYTPYKAQIDDVEIVMYNPENPSENYSKRTGTANGGALFKLAIIFSALGVPLSILSWRKLKAQKDYSNRAIFFNPGIVSDDNGNPVVTEKFNPSAFDPKAFKEVYKKNK